tara:strand:- start:4505 stop:4726 length:222 start_codon:yes stop_codon:yes gene_type:complete
MSNFIHELVTEYRVALEDYLTTAFGSKENDKATEVVWCLEERLYDLGFHIDQLTVIINDVKYFLGDNVKPEYK